MAPETPGRGSHLREARGRFNEAGARWPRKLRNRRQVAPAEPAASMRPGQDGPGNRGSTSWTTRTTTGFNEAGARWPRKRAWEQSGEGEDWTLQ